MLTLFTVIKIKRTVAENAKHMSVCKQCKRKQDIRSCEQIYICTLPVNFLGELYATIIISNDIQYSIYGLKILFYKKYVHKICSHGWLPSLQLKQSAVLYILYSISESPHVTSREVTPGLLAKQEERSPGPARWASRRGRTRPSSSLWSRVFNAQAGLYSTQGGYRTEAVSHMVSFVDQEIR